MKLHVFRLEETVFYEARVRAETREEAQRLLMAAMDRDDADIYEVDNSGMEII